MMPKGVDVVWCGVKVAIEPWKPPKGPGAGGECFAPFSITTRNKSEQPRSPLSVALRVSADPWALEGPFGGVRRSQIMKFRNFINIENIKRGASGNLPGDPG